MDARPRRNETDNDLLEFQKQFLYNKTQPSATVVKSKNKGEEVVDTNHVRVEENAPASVLSEIVRTEQAGTKQTSVFAREFRRNRSDFVSSEQEMHPSVDHADALSTTPDDRHSVGDEGPSHAHLSSDSQQIHEENLAKIASMTPEQIKDEQSRLLKMLDPKLVKFIQTRKRVRIADPDENDGLEKLGAKVKVDENWQQTIVESSRDDSRVPILRDKNWLHMDGVEADKLAWMEDLPPPTANLTQTGQTARFDFCGNFVAVDADVPVHFGLHHHGDEPERAGYSLDELFTLSRSSNYQQRSLALRALAAIVRRARRGDFIDAVATPIVPALLDGGLVFLLRWSLDDRSDAVVVSAIDAMHATLVNSIDEEQMDKTFCYHRGTDLPGLAPVTAATTDEDTDADVAKRDVSYALVRRMDLLKRFHYILSTRSPQAPAVIQIIETCISLARHSQSLAYEIFKEKNLLALIIASFLPQTWKAADSVSHVYGQPLPVAMKLIRVLAQAGRSMASTLISKYQIMERIIQYISLDARQIGLPGDESFRLQLESYRAWTVMLQYGHATSQFVDMCQLVMTHIRDIPMRLAQDRHGQTDSDTCLDVAIVCLVEAAVGCIRMDDCNSRSDDDTSHAHRAVIEQRHVTSFVQPITVCLSLTVTQMSGQQRLTNQGMTLAASCMNFLAAVYSQPPSQDCQEVFTSLDHLKSIWQDIVTPFWASPVFRTILKNLVPCSNVLCTDVGPPHEAVTSLPQHGVIYHSDDRNKTSQPILHPHSPYHLLTALTRLLWCTGCAHKGLGEAINKVVMSDPDIMTYLTRLTHPPRVTPSYLTTSHFTRIENIFTYYCLKISTWHPNQHMDILHKVSLHLLTRLLSGDGGMARDILSTIIFNYDFLCNGHDEEVVSGVNQLSVRSRTRGDTSTSPQQLLQDTRDNLIGIRTTYFSILERITDDPHHQQSRMQFLGDNLPPEMLIYCRHINEALLPVDWAFLPLVHFYNQSESGHRDPVTNDATEHIRNCLRWLHTIEYLRPDVLSTVTATLKVTRLMCLFLAGPDFFLDPTVHTYMYALLHLYTSPTNLRRLLFTDAIPGLSSFHDFYVELLEQYSSVSFADPLFANYLLLPVLQDFDSALKIALWGDHVTVLRSLSLPFTQLVVPLERFLQPDETDTHLLHLYARALLSEHVKPDWAPLPYLVAVHHVNRYLYSWKDRDDTMKRDVWSRVVATPNRELRAHLIYYKQWDETARYGIVLYSEMPPVRKSLLETLNIAALIT